MYSEDETWTSAGVGFRFQAQAAGDELVPSTRSVSSASVWKLTAGADPTDCDHPGGRPGDAPPANRSSTIAVGCWVSAGPTRRLSTSSSPATPAGRANPTCPPARIAVSTLSTAATGLRDHFPSGPRYWLVSPRKTYTWSRSPWARSRTWSHRLLSYPVEVTVPRTVVCPWSTRRSWTCMPRVTDAA